MENIFQLIGFLLGVLVLGLIVRVFYRALSPKPNDPRSPPGKGGWWRT